MTLTRIPIADDISMIPLFSSKSCSIVRNTAKYTRMAVTNQIINTDARAPMISARCHPKDILLIKRKKKPDKIHV